MALISSKLPPVSFVPQYTKNTMAYNSGFPSGPRGGPAASAPASSPVTGNGVQVKGVKAPVQTSTSRTSEVAPVQITMTRSAVDFAAVCPGSVSPSVQDVGGPGVQATLPPNDRSFQPVLGQFGIFPEFSLAVSPTPIDSKIPTSLGIPQDPGFEAVAMSFGIFPENSLDVNPLTERMIF